MRTHRPGGRPGAALLIFLVAANVLAQVPPTLRYQGYVADGSGVPLDGSVMMTFSIYTTETGGAPLWWETRQVVSEQGLFAVDLGETANPFPAGLFDTPLYLGIAVGADAEMTPRQAFSAAPYAQRAADAAAVGGMSAVSLDQSAEVQTLSDAQADILVNQAELLGYIPVIQGLGNDVAMSTSDIAQLQTDVADSQSGIAQLETDLAATDASLAVVESTLPTLQVAVSGSCPAGSAIRQITPATGAVTCETDDAGPWSEAGSTAYLLAGNVGVGTASPSAALQIDAAAGVDSLRARVGGLTKLLVHDNGGVSVGTSGQGPDDGLYVAGDLGLGTAAPAARLTVTDSDWHMTLRNLGAGGNEWFVGSSSNAWGAGGGKLVFSPDNASGNAAMALESGGDIGIGTVSPEVRLHVTGGSDVSPAGGGFLMLGNGSGTNVAIDSNEIMARNDGAAATLALNAEGGKVTMNTSGSATDSTLFVRGVSEFDVASQSDIVIGSYDGSGFQAAIRPTSFETGLVGTPEEPFGSVYSERHYAFLPTNYLSYSDRALKRNVRRLTGALNIVGKIDAVTYEILPHPFDDPARPRSAEEDYDRRNQMGFIAQDLEAVLPQLVSEEPGSGLKAVGYLGLVPVLVAAVNEQQRQIEAQAAQLEAQQEKLDELLAVLARKVGD